MPAAEVTVTRAEEPLLRKALLVAGMVLSSVDALFTLRFAGRFTELNPLLGRLLAAPLLFVAVKTALAFGALVTLARLEHSRAALVLLGSGVLVYLAVDGYWLWGTLHGVAPNARITTW